MFYFSIETDSVVTQTINCGLLRIIEYIGNKELPNNGQTPFEAGVEYIDRYLHRNNKTAIRRLVHNSAIRCSSDGARHAIWRIHAFKAKKIFGAINHIVSKYDNDDITSMTTQIMKCLHNAGLPNCGISRDALCVGSPYCPLIRMYTNGGAEYYSPWETAQLNKVRQSIESTCLV